MAHSGGKGQQERSRQYLYYLYFRCHRCERCKFGRVIWVIREPPMANAVVHDS